MLEDLFSDIDHYLRPFGFLLFAFKSCTQQILFVYFLVVTFDGFSQVSGQVFGKHKFFSKLSPNKTLEGFLGGVFVTVGSAVLARFWINFSFSEAVLSGIFLCLSSLSGDLSASYIKRLIHIKDYSKLLLGHGGVLDRFDSFITSGALYYIFFYNHLTI